MKTNARKYISLLLALCMVVSLLPAAALASADGNCTGEHSGWTELSWTISSNSFYQNGNYYLNSDVSTYQGITINYDVTLCLNGHTLNMGANTLTVSSDATLTICDCGSGGAITGTVSYSNLYNMISVEGGTLNLESGTISGTTTGHGSLISVTDGGTLNVTGGTISLDHTRSVATDGVQAVKLSNSTGSFTGGEVSLTTAVENARATTVYQEGGSVTVGGSAEIVFEWTTTEEKPNSAPGYGALCVTQNGSVTVKDNCTITASRTGGEMAGAVSVGMLGGETGTATITGGDINGFLAVYGTAEISDGSFDFIQNLGTLTMTGGTVENENEYGILTNVKTGKTDLSNVTINAQTGVYVNTGLGPTIRDGVTINATQYGVYGSATLVGAPSISGNTADLYIDSMLGTTAYPSVDATGYTGTEELTVQERKFPDAHQGGYIGCAIKVSQEKQSLFSLANSNGNIVYQYDVENDALRLYNQNAHPICGASCDHGDASHSDPAWQKWTTPSNYTLTGGSYYLSSNVTLIQPITVTGDVNLCLNGTTIKRSDGSSSPFQVQEGGSLTICDCQTGGRLTGGIAATGGNIGIYGGTISGGAYAVDLGGNAKLTLAGSPALSGTSAALKLYTQGGTTLENAAVDATAYTGGSLVVEEADVPGGANGFAIRGGEDKFNLTYPSGGYRYAYEGGGYVIRPDHTHSYTYSGSGAVITEKCDCGHSATATISIRDDADLTYTGSAITPAKVEYSTGWQGGELTPTYENNTDVGTATAKITIGGATASVNFTITRAGQTPPVVGEGYTIDYEDETITVQDGYEVYTAQSGGTQVASGSKIEPGETYYIRRAETTTQEASEFTPFTVAERPATPAAPAVTGKTDTSITISTESGCEYSIDGGSWVGGSGSHTFENLTPGTDYIISVRVPATASTFASDAASTTVTTKTAAADAPDAPSKSAITVTDDSITVTGSVSGQEYAVLPAGQQPQEDDWQAGGGDLTFNNLEHSTQYVVWTRTEETDTAMPSQASSVSVTTAAKTPDSYTDGVTVNYTDETITVRDGYEVSTDGQDWSESAAFGPGETYYVRVKEQNGVPASESVSFTTASRPEQPGEQVTVTGETIKGKGDGTITVPEGMEYSTGGENWVSGPATLTGLSAGTTVTVRVQATDDAPHGFEQTYTVQASSVTLTVTFNENGGSEVTDITGLSYNDTVTAPAITRAGYTLDGWYNGDAKWDFENGQVTADLSLTARWTLDAPTVSLTASAESVTYGTEITLTATATHAASVTYTYEWYKGGVKLDNSGNTLTLKTVADSGSYTVKVTASDGSQSKTVESSAVSVTITKATPDYTVPSVLTATYGDLLSSVKLPDGWSWDDGSVLVGNAGERSHSATFTPTDTANYDTVKQNITVQVNRAALTPSVGSVADKIYDGNTSTTGTIELEGAVLNENPTASGVFTFENADAGTGKDVNVTVTLNGSWDENYVLSTETLTDTANITPKTVGLEWSGYENLVYNGEPVSVTAAATGLVSGDQCAVTVENGAQTNAGTYTATATGLDNPNYQLPDTGTTRSYTIAPCPVELSWSASSFTYDGSEKTVTATIENLVNNDNCALTYRDNAKTGHGSYTAEVTALGNDNYTLTNGTGLTHSWSIGKAVVSFSVSGNSHTYDGSPKTAVVTQDAGQTPIPAGGYTVTYDGEDSQTEAGTYDIAVTITNGDFCFADGKDSMVVGKLTIGEQAVEIPAADDTAFTYNGAEQTYNIAESELYTVEGDVQKDAGSYTVIVSLNDKANYTWPDGTTEDKTYDFVIAAKPVTATWMGLNQVYGDGQKVSLIIDGLEGGDSVEDAVITGISTEAGSHRLTVTLENYVISPSTATLVVQQKPVVITVTETGGNTVVSAPGLSESDYKVTYKDRNGNTVTDTTQPGTYEIWVEFTNPNYRHTDGSSNKQVGSFTVGYGPVRTYTISFSGGNGASGNTASLTAAGGSYITLPECGFTKPGSVFTGWKYGSAVYKPGDSFTMPYTDITITAQWTQTQRISGTVKDEYGVPVAGAAVSIWLGSDKLGETASGSDGAYSFTDLAPGSYNILASVGDKSVTTVVTVGESGAVTGGNIILPEGNTSTRVEITPGSPDIVVGELDRVFDNTDGEDYTAADAETVKNGGTVEITFTADEKKQAEVQDEVKQLQSAGGVNLSLFLDCTLEKEVYDSEGTKVESASGFISQSSVLLEVRLPLPTAMQGKYGYNVLRIHEGEAQALSTSANSLGEYFEVSADKSALILHLCCFSTYAVGYENAPVLPPVPTENAPNVSASEHGSVTVFPNLPTTGTVVTITPKPDEGYTVDRITVTDASGNAVEVKSNGDGTYSFTQPAGAVTITATFKLLTEASDCPRDESCPMSGYTDLDMGAWYHDGIHYCLDEGLMDGVGTGLFAPNATTSRAMIVTILWRLQGSPEAEAAEMFTDVAPGDWYADAIAWAASEGVAEGYEDGSFRPNDAITREQLAAMLWRYAGSPGADGALSAFVDWADTSSWAQQALSWAVAQGLITGADNDMLAPKGQATRAQTATILMRFAQSI